MGEYLSWSDIAAASGNVALNVAVALTLATLLVTAFALFGRRYSLDARVFPTVSANQREWFGLLGFYLLVLTAMEMLNPPSVEFLASSSIAFRPSFLNSQFMGLATQDVMSIAALAALVVVFVMRIRQLNQSTSRFPRQVSEEVSNAEKSLFRQRSATLRFSFGFVAVSLLIAIIAPGLTVFGAESFGTIVILGLFLIGGVTSYLQGMQLGALYSAEPRSFILYQLFRHVFLTQWVLYIGIALAGYLIHTGLPGHFSDDPNVNLSPELSRIVSKLVAGVLVVMAAYLLCWGVDGFTTRLQRFIVVATLLPAVLPFMKLVAVMLGKGDAVSMESDAGFATLYAVVLLIVPLLAYLFSAPERSRTGSGVRSIAFVRTLGWSPFVIGRTLVGDAATANVRFVPFSTSEELLEDMVGSKARGASASTPGSVKLRHRLGSLLGWHHDYDAVMLDVRTAMRLFDALDEQGRLVAGRYHLVAGICRRADVLIERQPEETHARLPFALWPDAPYLPRNEFLEQQILASLRGIHPDLQGVDFLPPNCIQERLRPGAIAAVPEPFATALLSSAEKRGDTHRLDAENTGNASWWYENYDVLLLRADKQGNYPTQFLDMMIAGRDWLRTKPGPTGLGGTFARQITAELEGVTVAELESDPGLFLDIAAVSARLSLTDFQASAVIDPDGRRNANWEFVRGLFEHMQEAGLIRSLTIEKLAGRIDCSHLQQNTDFMTHRAAYPLRVNRYLTNDTPGKLRDMLHTLYKDEVNLSFLLAQRVAGAGGVGLVYMLPTNGADDAQLSLAASHQEWIAAGTAGFLAVSISDDPWGLRRMLDVVHADPELSIETLAAFPGPHGRAIALMSFGDISDARLRRLIGALKEHGFDITTEPSQWSGARS